MHIDNGRIYDVSLRKSVPLGSTRLTTLEKSQELAADVERFLKNGGRITEVNGFEPKPKRPHYSPNTPARANNEVLPEIRTKGRKAISWPESVYVKDKLFAAGFTYAQLAEIAGVPKGTLDHWFQKIMIPSHAWKARIAEGLDILMMKSCKTTPNHTR